MKLYGDKISGKFIKRPNRFEALVEIDNELHRVHVPNTGRMSEMLFEGTEVILLKSNNPNRKTKFGMLHVIKNKHLICINSILANRLFEEGIKSGVIDWVDGQVKREVTYGNSRIDFFIEGENNTFVEIKCCTYEENGVVMFPDAPTERGRKHLDELIKAVNNGYDAAVVIFAFMDYVDKFTPNYKIDPEFGEKLKYAVDNGVLLKVYRCKIGINDITIDRELEVSF